MTDTTSTQPEVKSVFTSKTILGVVVAAIPSVLALFGIKVLPGFSEASSLLIESLMTFGGSAVAIWGRIVATKKLVVLK